MLEESGFYVRTVKLIALKDRHAHPPSLPRRLGRIYKITFLCELIGGEAASSIETSEVGLFRRSALPELSVGRTLTEDIALVLEHHENPTLNPYFD